MSRHDGVSCDSCLIGNFRGKRYKCLICYDYDLCATCYEAGATTTRHTTEHPMQCILTRTDFDLYYGGEAVSVEQPQSFTCPFCGKMGFTESTLQDHVSTEHTDTSFEVVCPVCAALPGGDPNLVTDDFAAHLTLEHRNSRDLDEPSSSRHVRRIPHPGRGVGATRARRSNMHFSSSGGLASLSPSSRESMDPIAELLSQLSGVRRGGGAAQSSTTTQLQQLQMQLQLERQQAQVARQQLERLPRRTAQIASGIGSGSSGAGSGGVAGGGGLNVAANAATAMTVQPALAVDSAFCRPASSGCHQFLLTRCAETPQSEADLQQSEVSRADRSFFVRELLMDALIEGLSLDSVGIADCTTVGGLKFESLSLADEALPRFPILSKDVTATAAAAAAAVALPQAAPRNASSTAQTSKKTQGQQQESNGGGRSGSARNGGAPHREPQQQQQQQHGSSSGGVGGNSGGRSSSNHSAGQGQPSAQQRVAPSGTGTVREVPAVQQQQQQQPAVVTSGRIPVRSGNSPSSSNRRKLVRHLDGRNQSNEPPPPH